MAREPKASKSESLTIRLDPKTRFVLEYVSRLKGQTITTVVERAILEAADQETVVNRATGDMLSWTDFWDISEGVRALKMAERKEFFPSYEDEKRLLFTREHWPFFYGSDDFTFYLNYYIDVLWPHIDKIIQIHDDNRMTNYFEAGHLMQEMLRGAKLEPPEWPIMKNGEPVIYGISRNPNRSLF